MVAPACRWKPSSSMTRRTRAAVAELTPDSSLTTRDTVLIDTAARRATSAIVGRLGPSSERVYVPPCDNVGTGAHYPRLAVHRQPQRFEPLALTMTSRPPSTFARTRRCLTACTPLGFTVLRCLTTMSVLWRGRGSLRPCDWSEATNHPRKRLAVGQNQRAPWAPAPCRAAVKSQAPQSRS